MYTYTGVPYVIIRLFDVDRCITRIITNKYNMSSIAICSLRTGQSQYAVYALGSPS